MSFAQINDINIHYAYEPGPGPVLVFSNSLGTDFRIWDAVIAQLGGRVGTLCYDKRGHGLSDLGQLPMTMDDHVDDVSGLMDMLGIKRAVICGLSVGGLIAQGLAARFPDKVAGLILCDTGHKIGTDEMWNMRIETVKAKGIAALADGILERWFSPDYRQNVTADFAGYRNMLTRTPAEGYAGTSAAIRDTDYTAQTAAIRVPTHCLVGDQDGATTPDLVREMAGLINGASFEIIKDAGHLPCIEQPDAVTASITEFLDRLGDAPT